MAANSLRRAGRFATVGMLGTILDFALFTLLHAGLGVPTLAANTTSYGAGIANNFVWHRSWTYGDRSHRLVGPQLAQFLAVSLSAMAVNNLLLLTLAPGMGDMVASPTTGSILAKLVATGVAMCFSYLANTYWTFCSAN